MSRKVEMDNLPDRIELGHGVLTGFSVEKGQHRHKTVTIIFHTVSPAWVDGKPGIDPQKILDLINSPDSAFNESKGYHVSTQFFKLVLERVKS